MSALVNVAIHPTQFPGKIRCDLIQSLRSRAVNHKFHYDSVKQTQKWLALHQAYAPSRKDPDCTAIYDAGFASAAAELRPKRIHVIGLGCGGGQKDTRLLSLLKEQGKEIAYTPCDVSTAMVLIARQTASAVVPEDNCFPIVCDLGNADDLPTAFASRHPAIITFFGMIPNFEPEMILPKLASIMRPEDRLLFSANLAPGTNYAAGVKKVLSQYDNRLTHDWLLAFLFDLGVESSDGELRFLIEDEKGLKRIVACFEFRGSRTIAIEDETFEFRSGDSIRLFFSYRYTPSLAEELLQKHGLEILGRWVTRSEEEGVFLCRRTGAE